MAHRTTGLARRPGGAAGKGQAVGAEPPPLDPPPFQLATPADREEISAWLAHSEAFQVAAGLAEDQWTWYSLLDALDDELEAERLFWWKPSGLPPAGLVMQSYRNEEKQTFGLVLAPWDQLKHLLTDLRHWPTVGERQLGFKTPCTDNYAQALQNANWTADWDFDLFIYLKQLMKESA